jgi:small-conductance mechanosensitive channel
MFNKLLWQFSSIILSIVNISHAEEESLLGKLTSSKVISHSTNLINDIWHYEITSIDNKSISISNVAISIVLFIIGIKIAKYLSITIRRRMLGLFHLDSNASNAIEKFIYYILIALITLTALDVSNIPLSGLTFIGGALAIGIGFGSQNVLNNFISGIIIMIESPISVGDIIEIEEKIAVVMNIGARCVHLKTYDNIDLLVPNSTILQDNITNWTLEDNIIRVTSSYLIDDESSPELTCQLLKQALQDEPGIVQGNEAVVCFDKFDLYGMKFDIYFYINTLSPMDRKQILSNLNMSIHKLFTANNVKIAYYKGMF